MNRGGGWLVSTSPGVWNALDLIHSRALDIQHRTADSPDVIGSQGNLQLSQDLGGFLNSPSEFLQQKKKGKKARGVNIPRDSLGDCKSSHGSFHWNKLFPERPEKKKIKNQTQPQTTNASVWKKIWTGLFQRECQVPVTPFIQGTGRERTPDSLEEFPLSCLLTLFLYTAVIPPGSTVIKSGNLIGYL